MKQVALLKITGAQGDTGAVRTYLAVSTAPINIEDREVDPLADVQKRFAHNETRAKTDAAQTVTVTQILVPELAAAIRAAPNSENSTVPVAITYFDCTDYKENGKRVLSLFQPEKPGYPHWLMAVMSLAQQGPNGHSGYFYGELSRQLLYGYAVLGRDRYETKYPDADQGWKAAQLRVLRGR